MKTIHFIGIGGAGMSGIAQGFHWSGFRVKGSDTRKTKVTERLESQGIEVKEGHFYENIEGVEDYVVYSSCIPENNPELHIARHKGIPILRRIEALNMLIGDKSLIAISGAHGKTTTTALISFLLIEAGLDPSVFVGADVDYLGGNARWGKGEFAVSEADESDGSFLLLNPLYSVSTNIDREHMDYYSSMDDVISAYRTFIENTKDEGAAVVCVDDENIREIVKDTSKRILGYGFSEDALIRAKDILLLGLDGSEFNVVFKGKDLGRIRISIMGLHNVLNSLASIAIAMDLGVEFSLIKSVISKFRGADRRFKVTRLSSDILVIDDYAHHPTEIKATLKVLGDSGKRIIACFQPHRYSRTKYLKEQFGRCFDLAEHLVITDIYTADEKPIDGVSANDICESAKKFGHKNVNFVHKDDIIEHLKGVVRPGDAVFILGAGDIGKIPEKLVKVLERGR